MTPDLFQTNDRRVNADMVQLARASRGMTQAEAADAASVTQALLSKIENKLVVNPSEDIVAAFARALRYPVDFFYQTGRTHGLPHYHYRKRSKLGAKTLATIQAVINIRRQHVQKLVRSVDREIHRGIPQIDLDETNMTPAQVAEKMREYWMVPRGPLGDVTELVETAGGIVILSDFGTRFLDAISFRLPGLPPLFFMNSELLHSTARTWAKQLIDSHPRDEQRPDRHNRQRPDRLYAMMPPWNCSTAGPTTVPSRAAMPASTAACSWA